MADKLDEATLIIVDDRFNFLQFFASCNPISLLILLAWLGRELWRRFFKHQNIFSEVKQIEQRTNADN